LTLWNLSPFINNLEFSRFRCKPQGFFFLENLLFGFYMKCPDYSLPSVFERNKLGTLFRAPHGIPDDLCFQSRRVGDLGLWSARGHRTPLNFCPFDRPTPDPVWFVLGQSPPPLEMFSFFLPVSTLVFSFRARLFPPRRRSPPPGHHDFFHTRLFNFFGLSLFTRPPLFNRRGVNLSFF